MMHRFKDARILMYSHDTFGLGHLRRCRTIAHSLVEDYRGLNILIISGATIAGAFDYRARVDFVKIPSVIKLRNGEYTSLARHIDLHETLKMRQSIIRQTAESFEPDIFIVDKEPMGLRGEIEETLSFLKRRGCKLVLGLREVMDAPRLLEAEWKRNDVMGKIDTYYDRIWVYGPPEFYDPLVGLDAPKGIRDRMDFVGFLQRSVSYHESSAERPEGDYILVTTGGGGDGSDLIHNVIDAYQNDPMLPHKALVVLGPYMPARERVKLTRKAAKVPQIEVIEFDNRMEELIAGATAVVAMGGYNTYCEILSFNKPALIVPRLQPREEQLIRARRASEIGLVDMLLPAEAEDPARLAATLRALPERLPPSASVPGFTLEGLPTISRIVGDWLIEREEDELQSGEGQIRA
ncbi:glycosyltransferase family protein [Rhizobiaceae bacterium n13]|uniref:Glycosyltransferase family protein n=1 Tax=Ferirhizobium litorale TaxID=2927786 RepID=A0AAE3QA54_9HYPH|nr:glycosyltransferase family protein [Fererhizobium litorale]MDI7861661.1 glycosyltransferase family protein [Fererhizobium litorale]MDI7921997.1 glycosyltransferase family protein [Fererhizobium litorale]